MATIKAYKELEKEASPSPWAVEGVYEGASFVTNDISAGGGEWYETGVLKPTEYLEISEADARIIAMNRNLVPDLIRVIELAEESLKWSKALMEEVRAEPTNAYAEVIKALSEIRKLKGD